MANVMNKLLEEFEDLPAIIERIDKLTEQAESTKGRVEKKALLNNAQRLADAYQSHCEENGNNAKQFKQII